MRKEALTQIQEAESHIGWTQREYANTCINQTDKN